MHAATHCTETPGTGPSPCSVESAFHQTDDAAAATAASVSAGSEARLGSRKRQRHQMNVLGKTLAG